MWQVNINARGHVNELFPHNRVEVRGFRAWKSLPAEATHYSRSLRHQL